MYTKSNNIEVILGNETDEIIDEFFNSFLQSYPKNLQESMRGSFFYCAGLLYYKFYKIRLIRDGPYIVSANQLNNEKETINPKNDNGKCFNNTGDVALNQQNIKNSPERISKIKPFIINITGNKSISITQKRLEKVSIQ